MKQRPGVSLVEVLVAIFVMAIGLIALLTLFPFGALRMAQAIQDDACSKAAANASAIATIWDIRNDFLVSHPRWAGNTWPLPTISATNGALWELNSSSARVVADVFQDTNLILNDRTQVAGVPNGRLPGGLYAADPNGPSYPVYVDPIGWLNAPPGAVTQRFLGQGLGSTLSRGLIARSTVSFIPDKKVAPQNVSGWGPDPLTLAYRWFTLQDDLIFSADESTDGGTPFNLDPNPGAGKPAIIRRDIRYSWAYLVQRPRSADPSIVTCSVVVYNKRPLALTGGLALAEATYGATFDLTKNTISIDWGALGNPKVPPSVRPGDWLLDCSYVPSIVKGVNYGSAHGNFYRVVGVTESPGQPTKFEYEVQQRIRNFPAGGVANGTVIILEGVADVYERHLDRKPN